MTHNSKITKRNAYLAPVLISIFSVCATNNAFADVTDLCSTELNAVQNAINTSIFLGKNAESNQDNLTIKLSAADFKISENKYGDAIIKLLDISDKATEWVNAPKKKLEDASAINSTVLDAINCVKGL